MRISLELVVVAVVILVVALVLLTIFASGMNQITPVVAAKNNCEAAGRLSCSTAGQLPGTWYSEGVGPNGESCGTLLPGCTCDSSTGVFVC